MQKMYETEAVFAVFYAIVAAVAIATGWYLTLPAALLLSTMYATVFGVYLAACCRLKGTR